MLPEKPDSLHTYIGRYLFRWVVAKAHVWFLIYRCVDTVVQAHGPLDENLRILDRLLQSDEDDEDSDDGVVNNENVPLHWVFRAPYRWSAFRRTG